LHSEGKKEEKGREFELFVMKREEWGLGGIFGVGLVEGIGCKDLIWK